MHVRIVGLCYAWFDTGTIDSLVDAAELIRMIANRQGVKIFVPEEIAYRYGWISKETLLATVEIHAKSPYGIHLRNVAENRIITSVEGTNKS